MFYLKEYVLLVSKLITLYLLFGYEIIIKFLCVLIAAQVSKDNNQIGDQFLNYNSSLKTTLLKTILPNIFYIIFVYLQ